MTPGQQALSDGFAATLAAHGQVWVRTSDSAQVRGVATRLSVTNPAMQQANDREQTILVPDVTTYARLKKGDELTKSGKKFRVVRSDFNESTALWHVQLSPSF